MKKNSGFTLIELLLVVALVTSLGTLTTAYTARFLTQNAVQNAQDQIVGDLRKAQMYTMMGKGSLGKWGVNYSSNKITLYTTNTTFAARNTAFDETFSVNSAVSVTPFDLSFSLATASPNATQTITINAPNIAGIGSKTVTLNAQGMVTR